MEEKKSMEKIDERLQSKSYIIKEANPDNAFSIFKENISKGSKGLCITRTNPAMISSKYSMAPETIWMGSQTNLSLGQVDSIEEVMNKVNEFLKDPEKKEKVILLDRIDYLITVYGFEETLKFIYNLKDVTSFSNSTLLVHLNPSIISHTQYKFIEQEIQELIVDENKDEMTEDLKEIIMLIAENNKHKSDTYFKDVTKRSRITKTTARKRILALVSLGAINIKKKGRLKVLRLNDDPNMFAKDI